MKIGSIVLVALLVSLSATTLAAAPPDCCGKLAITGTWQPVPAQGQTATWEVLPDRLRLDIPAGSAGDCSIACSEPVPDGDWTMDLWMVLHCPGSYYSANTTVSVGEKGKGPYLAIRLGMRKNDAEFTATYGDARGSSYSIARDYHIRAGAGPIAWLRISYSKQTGRIKVRVNGQLATTSNAAAIVPPATPILHFKKNAVEAPSAFEVVSYQVTPGAEPDAYSTGAAYAGWQESLGSEGLRSVPDLADRLQKMYEDPRLTPAGRAYVLASSVLAEKASAGKVGVETWKQVADFVQANGQKDPISLLCILPIAAACADEAQRAEVRSWSSICAELPIPAWRDIADKHRSLQRVSLVDPVLTADVTLYANRKLHLRLTRSLVAQLSKTDPGYALALHVYPIGNDGFKCPRLAWMLPEIEAVCPSYYHLAVRNLCERADEKTETPKEHDRSLSYAAYRLASADPETALGLLGMIRDAQIRAETLPFMADALTEAQSSDMDKTIEAELRASISNWTESRSEPSPVERYVRLAKWYQTKGRTEDAIAAVRECTDKMGESTGARFRSARDIARTMFALRLPETDEWTKKAMDLALAADAEGSDTGGGIYITATFLMVTDLLAQDRFDDAFALANKAEPDGTSWEMIFTGLIQHIARTDMPRALEMLDEYPRAVSRNSLVANLIRRMDGRDPDKAKALFESIAPERKLEMAFRIGDALPREEMTRVCTDALTTSLKSDYRFGQYSISQIDAWLSGIGLDVLFSFEPMFAESYDRFAHEVLGNVADKCGLDDDWMWQCYNGTNVNMNGSGQLPWMCEELRRAIKSESEQVEGMF